MNIPTGKEYKQRLRELDSLRRKGRHADAVRLCDGLISDYPDAAQPMYLRGICALENHDFEAATAYFSHAVELESGQPEYHARFGQSLVMRNMFEPAADAFRRALELDARNVVALSGLATVMIEKRDEQAALDYLNSAAAIQPSDLNVNLQLMKICANAGKYDQALLHGKKALRASGESSDVWAALGDAQLTCGREEEALKSYANAIQKDATNSQAYLGTVELRKIRDPSDKLIKKMEAALTRSMSARHRKFIHFALGKAYADCGQHENAFQHYAKANRLEHRKYLKRTNARLARQIRKTCTAKFLREAVALDDFSPKPVFIVGMPRSGSTLIDQILSSHSQVVSVGESAAMSRVIEEILEHGNNKLYAERVDLRTLEKLRHYREIYANYTSAEAIGAGAMVDKNPFNFFHLGLIALLFPNARIIHTTRNPLDTCLSCFFTGFASTGPAWAHEFDLIGDFYRQYQGMMAHWKKVLPIPILDLNYEQVVEDTETNARRAVEFCGLEWEASCLEFYKARRAVSTASVAQVRKPVYRSSVGRWVPYAAHLQPLVDALGDTLEGEYDELRKAGLSVGRVRPSLSRLFAKLNPE